MQPARRAATTALALVIAVCLSSGPARSPRLADVALAASVAWPVSTLIVSEIQTGGSSASDEFVEIANSGNRSGRHRRTRGGLRDLDRLDGHA